MIRRLDALGVALLVGLAVALMGGGFALVAIGVVKGWELVTVISFGAVLLAAAHPRAPSTTPHNTMVHGSARPAAEQEAHEAARGSSSKSPMHAARFSGLRD